jgi:hypothetical protein
MWIGVKRQLAVVTVDSDTAGVLWRMPHNLTNAECADMLYVYGFCDGSAAAAAEFSKMYCLGKPYQLCHLNNKYWY